MSNDSKPTTFIIFGASGDLTERKLIPALFNSYCKGRLPESFNIVGFARRPWDDAELRQVLQAGMQELAPDSLQRGKVGAICRKHHLRSGGFEHADRF
jgi:glucose-6-phosphate 1-dehydrogenase